VSKYYTKIYYDPFYGYTTNPWVVYIGKRNLFWVSYKFCGSFSTMSGAENRKKEIDDAIKGSVEIDW